jgi:hypothetical protein
MSMVYYAQKAFARIVFANLKMDSIRMLKKKNSSPRMIIGC